jgi:hypothetical protein
MSMAVYKEKVQMQTLIALALGVAIIAVVLTAVFAVIGAKEMEICQETHNFDTCFQELNC